MSDANNSGEAVRARLWSVLPADDQPVLPADDQPGLPADDQLLPVVDRPWFAAADLPALPPSHDRLVAADGLAGQGRRRQAGPDGPVGLGGSVGLGEPMGLGEPAGVRGPAAASGATGRLTALGAFDPGRRGVKALAVVALVVILGVALLAWRSRPRVEPVSGAPVPQELASPGAVGPGARADGPGDIGGETAAGGVPAGVVGAGSAAAPGSGAARGAPAEIVVAVGGKVLRPGLVHLPPGARVADALQAAGGADRGIDVALLNLARKVVDGELIMVGVTPPAGATGPPRGVGGVGGPAGGKPGGGPVNLNTATLAELDALPGVGPVLAQRILDRRDQQGGFAAVSDLRKVEGIGASRFEQLKDLVTVA